MDNLFFYKKIYFYLLGYIAELQQKGIGNNNKPNILTICSHFKHKHNIPEDTTRTYIDKLIFCDYLVRGETVTSNIFITDKGKVLLREHNQYQMLPKFSKFTIFFNKNLVALMSILSIAFLFPTENKLQCPFP